MQDRVSRYPGRVRLVPVSGQANVYDMELADSPSVAGTPLNKANLLTDATATAMGLTSSATPNTAFNRLNTKIDTNNTTLTNAVNGIKSNLSWTQIGSANLTGLTNGDTFSISLSTSVAQFDELCIIAENLKIQQSQASIVSITNIKSLPYNSSAGGERSNNLDFAIVLVNSTLAAGGNQYIFYIDMSVLRDKSPVTLFSHASTGYGGQTLSMSIDGYIADMSSVTTLLSGSITGGSTQPILSGTITVYGRSNP